jgi:transcriptional regulator with XRE-family HTH domain
MHIFNERRKMFYQKIEQEIGKRKINLNQLAKGAGIPQSGTSRWKKGTMPSCEALIKICQYLNISADYLLDLDETPPPPALTDEEKDLLDHFRQCDPGTQKSIHMLANTGATENQTKETSLNSKKIG